jgi:hypothetical protein
MNNMAEKEYKIHNFIANLIVCLITLISVGVIYFTYLLNFHGNGWIWYDNIPFPTNKETYNTGEIVEYHPIYNQKRDAEKTVTRTIKSVCGDSYNYPPIYFSNAGETGVWEWWEKTTYIPDWFKSCDRAWISGTASYYPSVFRRITVSFKTQEFEIKAKDLPCGEFNEELNEELNEEI